MNLRRLGFKIILIPAILLNTGYTVSGFISGSPNRIQPYSANPAYWQYKNKPVLLLGGTSNDNLFQDIATHLDLELDRLVGYGGNYVRCTMSSRDSGNVYPFYRDTLTGLYDLAQWNDEYWRRFEYFLQQTHAREIIVQVEIWATYDFYTRRGHILDGSTAWDRNPFNPGNNINYTESESGLYEKFHSTQISLINPFFNTVLPLSRPYDFRHRPVVLGYQHKFVDKLLSVSLEYDHVLYVIDNETNADPLWSLYWAEYIDHVSSQRNTPIEVTEMWDTFDPTGGAVAGAVTQDPATHFFTRRSGVANTLYNTENYTYLDISNHNFQIGEAHYKTGLYVWMEVQKSGKIRPVNNTKIYGADGGWGWTARSATDTEGGERFWRNIFAGAASARFHRPPGGLGKRTMAMNHIKSMRMLTDSVDIFSLYPSNGLLGEREENEAFCLANSDGELILFFPSGGNIRLNAEPGIYMVHWLNIITCEWQEPLKMSFPGNLEPPGKGTWGVIIGKGI